jgi:hypothetical protein
MATKKLTPDQLELKKFYKPYLSDDEEVSDTESESSQSSGGSGSESGSVSSASSGAPSATASRQNIFASNGFPVAQMSGDKLPDNPSGAPTAFKQTTTKFAASKNSTTIMLNSTDRDTNVYPQPTHFSIRLPRIFRNVVGISVTQIKMLSSFYYFTAAKNNTSVRILEYGRQIANSKGVMVDNNIDVFLNDGTYDTNSLVTQLQNQLNRSPLYNNITLTSFIGKFISTGDYGLLFNDPGDTTYNQLTGVFDALQFKNQIIQRYFNTAVGGGISYYTTAQCLVAYYYPMLRDMTINNVPFITTPVPNPFAANCTTYVITGGKTYDKLNYYETDSVALGYLNGGSSYDRIVYGFQGLADPYIALLINDPANQAILQKYKDDNTWNGFLLNNYTCSYNGTSGRLTIYSDHLNTSLVTTLNNQYQTILLQQYINAGIDPNTVAGIQTESENLNGVVIDMYNYIQTGFTNYFAVNFGSFTPTFFTDISNSIFVSEAAGRYGWNLIYTGAQQLSTSKIVYPDASGSWPALVFNPAKMQQVGNDLYYDSPVGTVQYTYTHNLSTDASGYIVLNGSNEETLGYQDISFNILPTTYARVPLQSRCRQTLYVETIPPFSSEVPSVGNLAENYYMDVVNTPLLYQDASGNVNLLDPLYSDFFMYDISQNMLDGPDFMRQNTSYGQLWQSFMRQQKPAKNPDIIPPPGSLSIYTFRPHVFIEIHHNQYPSSGGDSLFSSDIYIEREDGLPIGADINAYWYRDRAAFMADANLALKNVYWNNPKNYFTSVAISGTSKGGVINTNYISNQTSYLMVTTASTTFSKIPLRIFTILHNAYGVYTVPTVADYRLLPVNPAYLSTKTTPTTNTPPFLPTLFNSSGFRNCYDLNGISNNLLDFFVLTTDFSHYDPYNLVDNTTLNQNPLQYIFQFKTPAVAPSVGTSTYSQFFSTGSANQIINNLNNSVYYSSTEAAAEIANKTLPFTGIANEYVFVNWFRAGTTTNLYNNGVTSPDLVPETTVAPFPTNDANGVDNPFSLVDSINYSSLSGNPNYNYYGYTPFSLCKNKSYISTDISFNDLSTFLNVMPGQIYLGPDNVTGLNNIQGIIGIPFMPPLGRYIVPKQIVIKFGYTQPAYDVLTNQLGRSTKIGLTTNQAYRYVANSNSPAYKNAVSDMTEFDDHFYQNRRNVALGVFKSSQINGTNIINLQLQDALCTLTLKKVTQVVEYSSSTDPNALFTKARSPEWGTYYVYETSSAASNLWFPPAQTFNPLTNDETTQWAAIKKLADFSTSIFTTSASGGTDTASYYTDTSGNSLCFVPFYPVLTPEQLAQSQDNNPTVLPFNLDYSTTNWAVGTFTALTYTRRPYIPILSAGSLSENPYIFYSGVGDVNSICCEQVGTDGISLGDTSTYLGAAGPLCWGYDINGNIVSPNYRSNGFSPTFFNVRINLTIPDTNYNPLTDLVAFGGQTQVNQCYTDTQLYVYDLGDKPNADYNDIFGGWGSEKAVNFDKFDDDSGYNYLSYIPKIKVDKHSGYTLQIRGYVPTVKFLSGIRLVGKNWTDFGEVTLKNLCDEIAELLAGGVSIGPDGRLVNDAYRINKYYSSDYARTLLMFNKMYIGTKTFGRGFANAGYGGMVISSTGFADFLNQYGALVTQVSNKATGITTAQNQAVVLMKSYIASTYAGILPPLVLTRNNFTDPLTFSIKFQSALIPPYKDAYDQWGLGWNLGFVKIDTPFTTRHVANSFIKIVDDFIYIMLDGYLNLNGLDVSNKEDLSLSRDTFGEKEKYYGKLLLNSFGSFSQTLVQSPKPFLTPVGKLEKLTFALHDANNRIINNNDCEFNVVLEISEMLDTIDAASLLVKGS